MTEDLWDILGKRWNLRILKFLELTHSMRFNELKQSVHGISANVLSDRLDELEKLGLVKRIVTNETSSHGYIINEKCSDLKKILLSLDDWISQWSMNYSLQNNRPDISTLTKQILELLKTQISKTEFNFINDKLLFTSEIGTHDLASNFSKLESIILELYGDETGNNILKNLKDRMKSLQINL